MTLSEAPDDGGTDLTLAAEFDTPSRSDWQQQVAAALRKSRMLPEDFSGAPESLLRTPTYDGFDLEPLYTASDTTPPTGYPGLPPFVRGSHPEGVVEHGWDVRAWHSDPDPAAANEALLADLESGAASVWLRTGRDGVPTARLDEALAGVRIELAPVVLDAGADYPAAADALLDLFTEHGIASGDAVGNIGADPIGFRARTGREHDVEHAARLAVQLAGSHPRLRTMVVDGLPYHEAGASDSQELGALVATGVAYLRALTAAGLDVSTAAAGIEFRLAATTDQFRTIAKLRAARRMWSRVTGECGVVDAARGMRQHAVSSPAMLTRYDPWVNILRGTLACFGAGVGGAESVTLLPFDHAIGQSDAFARRIARNTQSVLLEESKLSGVIDPAGGSWYVENLTDALAHAAWREFTGIERAGGIESELASGALADRIAETRDTRSARIATRADPITGISEFPDLTEEPVHRPATVESGERSTGLPRIRYAQDFERLRDAAESFHGAHGHHPRVFLATLGSLAEHTNRATFASNLLQAGGIAAHDPGVTDEQESFAETVAAFRGSASGVACICGTDSAYAQQANELAAALKEAGAATVLLAGKPAEQYTDIDGYLYAGCDALEVLTSTLETLGAQP